MLIDDAEIKVIVFFEHEGPEGKFLVVVEGAIQLGRDVLAKQNPRGDQGDIIFGGVTVDGQEMKLAAVNTHGAEAQGGKRGVPGATDGEQVGLAGEAQNLG